MRKINLCDLRKDWKKFIIDNMSKGASLQEIYGGLDISADKHEDFMKEENEYRDVINRGKRLSEMWWTELGRKNLYNKDFQVRLWNINMKNRFGWRERIDHTTNGKEIQPIQLLGGDSVRNNEN